MPRREQSASAAAGGGEQSWTPLRCPSHAPRAHPERTSPFGCTPPRWMTQPSASTGRLRPALVPAELRPIQVLLKIYSRTATTLRFVRSKNIALLFLRRFPLLGMLGLKLLVTRKLVCRQNLFQPGVALRHQLLDLLLEFG